MDQNTSNSSAQCSENDGVWLVFPVTYVLLYLLGLSVSAAAVTVSLMVAQRRKDLSVTRRRWSDSMAASFRRLKQMARKLVSGDNFASKLLISVALLCNLVYMALAFQRTYYRETRCFSSLAEVPDLAVELVISLPLIVFFAIRLLAADNFILFWFHLNTIVDVVTLPNVFIAIFVGQDWLDTKALRFFWLTQLTDILRFLPYIHSQDTIDAVALLVRLLALWMGAAGMVHLLESTGDPWSDFNNKQSNSFLEYAYFIMVTMATVGYGDYFAMTDIGRAFMTFFIITGIAFFTFALPNLVDLVVNYYHNTQWSKFDTTRVPRHVLVCGHITHTIVSDFLKDFLHKDRGDRKTHILFMHTERPDPELRKVLRSYYTRVQYVMGSVLKACDLAKAKIPASDKSSRCMAVFILAEKHCKDPETEDQENLLRLVSIKNTDSKIPVTIQVLLPSSKEKVKYIPRTSTDTVICLTQLKLGLLAQSCLCPGLSTLIGNFFYASEELTRVRGWLELYGKGVSKELYITSFSMAFDGMSFYSAAELCYEKMGLILLAIEDKQAEKLYISPSPSSHPTLTIRGSRTESWDNDMVGYFIGTDQHHVDMVSVYQESTVCENKSLGGIPLLPASQKRRLSSVHRCQSLSPVLTSSSEVPLHLCDPRPMEECLVDSQYRQVESDHVLLCVFADDKSSVLYLRNFLEPLRKSTIPEEDLLPVTIVAHQRYLEREWPCINIFPRVSVLPGSPLEWSTLCVAGVETCRVCVILTASKKTEEMEEAALRDKEAILCSLMIHNHHTKVGSPREAPPLIITDLIEESNVQFLDIEDEDDDKGHIYSAQPFACGEAFAASLFDSITSSTFHSPGILFLVERLISASTREQCCTQSTITSIPLSSLTTSSSVPCTTFHQLYSHMLSQNKTPLAISRLVNPAPSEGGAAIAAIVPVTESHRAILNSQRYIVTAPPPDTPLLPSDRILVLEEQF